MANRGNPNWTKGGQSPNPSGRGKYTLYSFLQGKKKLPQEIYDAVHPLLKSKSENIRLLAAEFLANRRDGKPAQVVELGVTPDEAERQKEERKTQSVELKEYLSQIVGVK